MNLTDLNQRSLDIFRELVDAYVETGEPVGSRTLSRRIRANSLSPATIRNIMADLEEAGLLYAPHTSAGRIPTTEGLRFFVNGLLDIGDLSPEDRMALEQVSLAKGKSVPDLLEEATEMLSGMSGCAGVVMVPKSDTTLRQVEFVNLGHDNALVVLISQDGVVENRLIALPKGITSSMLQEASNYINTRLEGRSLSETRALVEDDLKSHKAQLDAMTGEIVEQGLAVWAGDRSDGNLIVRGRTHLLDNVVEMADLERVRQLFNVLETKENLFSLVDAAVQADGIQIFIGAENQLFNVSGCSMIISPYRNSQRRIIGAIGVIGPTRMQYGRIIPMVDYTAGIASRLMGGGEEE